MPRQSHVGLQTLQVLPGAKGGTLETIKRVQPPPELTPEQRAEFVRVVDSMPADWFAPAHVALLVQYCRHVVIARRLAQTLDKLLSKRTIDPVKLNSLMGKQDSETRVIGKLMTMLRITPQAIEPPRVSEKRMRQTTTSNPWEA